MPSDPPSHDPADLDLSIEQMQAMMQAVMRRVMSHLEALPETPTCGDFDGIEDLCRSLRETTPEHGTTLESLLDPLFDEWIPRSFNAPHPGYFAYIPGGGVFTAALAELMGIIMNDGVRLPTVRIDELHFAEETPYEAKLGREPIKGEQVMLPEARG